MSKLEILSVVFLTCCTFIVQPHHAHANNGLVRFPLGDVGGLLRFGVERSPVGALREIFSNLSDIERDRLYASLREAQISAIDRVTEDNAGVRRFDPTWVVRSSIDGNSSGVLSASAIGTADDYFYSVRVEFLEIGFDDDRRDRRNILLDLELTLVGKGLNIVSPDIGEIKLKWQVDKSIVCGRASVVDSSTNFRPSNR